MATVIDLFEGRPPRIDRRLLAGAVASLSDAIARLRQSKPPEVAILRSDWSLQDEVGTGLYYCVRNTRTIASQMVSIEKWGCSAQPDAFDLMAKHGVIDARISSALADIAPLEKLLAHVTRIAPAHGYNGVDMDRIWAQLPADLAALEAFAAAVAAWLQTALDAPADDEGEKQE